jgi:uncharacterized protein (DUF1501 family)
MSPRSRRAFVRTVLGGAAAPLASLSLPALAAPAMDRRFVFVVLRGGMDGLGAVPAPGDADFAGARGPLAEFGAPPLALEGPFALNPNLRELHAMFGRGEALVMHATGLPYRERSHFDAQQVLESGGTRPYQLTTGWLARALSAGGGRRGIALNTAVPLVLRGAGEVDTWAPSLLPEPSGDLVARLARMYASDPALARALARAKGLHADPAMAGTDAPMGGAGGGRQAVIALARKAAEFLRGPTQVAVLEMGGWDTHANQTAPQGALAAQLRALDAALAALREGLSSPAAGGNDPWSRTVVVVATEFGREVAMNGTQGTDHGSGGAAFVLGGAVRGGRVVADWPGLAKASRFEGRDLRITTDLRSVLRNVLGEHLQVSRAALDREVFPDTAALPKLDLLRG